MSLAEAFAPAEQKYYNLVQQMTWGHLAPKPGNHPIAMLMAYGLYGDIVLVDAYHPALEDSPWLFQAMQEHMQRKVDRLPNSAGSLWIWTGYLRWYKNGNYRFVQGKWKRCRLVLKTNPQ